MSVLRALLAFTLLAALAGVEAAPRLRPYVDLAASMERTMMPAQFAEWRAMITEERYERWRGQGDYVLRRFDHQQGGQRLRAEVLEPRLPLDSPMPAVVYAHGGQASSGLKFSEHMLWLQFAEAGYRVYASEYRGGPNSDGVDEFGGADVDDLVGFVDMVAALPEVDASRVYLYGGSRGGMMVYAAVRDGAAVAAAVADSAPADMAAAELRRPELVRRNRHLMPGYAEDRDGVLRQRSALHFADRLDTPLLILHGDDDWRSAVEDAVRLAEQLQALGKPHRLQVYAGDGHYLPHNREGATAEALAWFSKHRRVR